MRWLAALALLAAAPTPAPMVTPAVLGLDHVPIAVADLDAAAARFRALGFALKPGRPHDNGIRNVHAKFPDGTELELLTAPQARDALTAKYRRFLTRGDGPAFLGFFAPDRAALRATLAGRGYRPRDSGPLVDLGDAAPLAAYFFAGRQRSPTDRPEHFAHPNGATALIGVWLAGDRAALTRLLAATGARLGRARACTPRCALAEVARWPEGEAVLLPALRRTVADRPIVGVTVRVRNLAITRRVLAKAGIATEPVRNGRAVSVFAPSTAANGLTIEFRQDGG